jgi:chemotaxis protein methyltransferase CheR
VGPDDFEYLAELLRRRAGIVLGRQKSHMAQSRLQPVVRRFGFKDVHGLMAELRRGHEALIEAATEAMTTNDSAFFRDRKTFEEFRDIVLPALLIQRAAEKKLRLWCAACAAGQEAYSIAMILDDAKLTAKGWTIELIASDINSEMVTRAQEGLYSQFEVQRGLPIRKLLGNFTQEGTNWRISEKLRAMVAFRIFNLLDSPHWLGALDVVFCRNVLMYFDQDTRKKVLRHIARRLRVDGSLLVGPTESLAGLTEEFVQVDHAPGLYYRPRALPPLRRAIG